MSTQTIQDRLLLRPSPELNDVVLGVLGHTLLCCPRAGLVAFMFLWNGYTMLLRVPDAGVLSAFADHVNGAVGREAGRLHAWKGHFWSRRYSAVQIVDPAAAEDRLQHVLALAVDAGLVERPTDWPGASSLAALLHGTPLRGTWHDRRRERAARNRRKPIPPHGFATVVEVPLVPLPAWQHLGELERRARCAKIMERIVDEAAARDLAGGRRPPGPQHVLAQHPHDLPTSVEHAPTPLCHASNPDLRRAHHAMQAEVALAFRAAAACVRAGRPQDAHFPQGCFPPSLPFVPVRDADGEQPRAVAECVDSGGAGGTGRERHLDLSPLRSGSADSPGTCACETRAGEEASAAGCPGECHRSATGGCCPERKTA